MTSTESRVSSKHIRSSSISSQRYADNNEGWFSSTNYSSESPHKHASKPVLSCRSKLDTRNERGNSCEFEALFKEHTKLQTEYKSLKTKYKSLQHNESVLTLYYTYYKKKSAKLKLENEKLVQDRKKIKQQLKHLVFKLEKRKEKNERLHLKLESMKVVKKFSNSCTCYSTNALTDESEPIWRR